MKKVKIEVEVPEGVDIEHALTSVIDACWWSENVTQKEHDLVNQALDRINDQLKQQSQPQRQIRVLANVDVYLPIPDGETAESYHEKLTHDEVERLIGLHPVRVYSIDEYIAKEDVI